jgi:hypothetical protein
LIARVEQLANRSETRAPTREQPPDAPTRAPASMPAREAAPRPQLGGGGPSVGTIEARGSAREQPPARSTPAPNDNPFQRFVPPESRERANETRAPVREQHLEPTTAHAEHGVASVAATARNLVPHQALAVAPAAAPERAEARAPSNQDAPAAVPALAPPAAPRAQISGAWPSVVDRMRSLEPRWAAMYEHGVPSEVSAARVVVVFPEGSFFGRQAQTPGGSDALRRAASEVFGATPEIVIKLAADVRGQSLAQSHAQQLDERKEGIKKRALAHPRVLEALKIFPELAQKQDVQVD